MRATAPFIVVSFIVSLAAAQPGRGLRPGPGPRGPGYHELTIDTTASKILLETPDIKIASLIVKKAATLAEHAAPVPVTIHAVSGSGTVKLADGTSLRVAVGKVVVLAPNSRHSVIADDKADLVLLVHHVTCGGCRGRRE